MRKLGVAQLKRKADKVWSEYIRLRDSFEQNGDRVAACITCGTVKPIKEMQNGHFVSRKSSSLRYDEQNCNTQCSACNVFRYGELYQYGLELDRKYGDGTANRLHDRRFETHKWTIPELEGIINYANTYIKEMA